MQRPRKSNDAKKTYSKRDESVLGALYDRSGAFSPHTCPLLTSRARERQSAEVTKGQGPSFKKSQVQFSFHTTAQVEGMWLRCRRAAGLAAGRVSRPYHTDRSIRVLPSTVNVNDADFQVRVRVRACVVCVCDSELMFLSIFFLNRPPISAHFSRAPVFTVWPRCAPFAIRCTRAAFARSC